MVSSPATLTNVFQVPQQCAAGILVPGKARAICRSENAISSAKHLLSAGATWPKISPWRVRRPSWLFSPARFFGREGIEPIAGYRHAPSNVLEGFWGPVSSVSGGSADMPQPASLLTQTATCASQCSKSGKDIHLADRLQAPASDGKCQKVSGAENQGFEAKFS
jgi:hypothetical protein